MKVSVAVSANASVTTGRILDLTTDRMQSGSKTLLRIKKRTDVTKQFVFKLFSWQRIAFQFGVSCD